MLTRLEKLKLLLGIEEEEKDTILSFALMRTEDMICNYCRLHSVPKGLETLHLNMAMDLYRGENFGQEEKEGNVKSITEGDVSVSFEDTQQKENTAFLNNYTAELDRYRKAGW